MTPSSEQSSDLVVVTKFDPRYMPDEMPDDETLLNMGRRLMERAFEARRKELRRS